jgi:hypothetical protein
VAVGELYVASELCDSGQAVVKPPEMPEASPVQSQAGLRLGHVPG